MGLLRLTSWEQTGQWALSELAKVGIHLRPDAAPAPPSSAPPSPAPPSPAPPSFTVSLSPASSPSPAFSPSPTVSPSAWAPAILQSVDTAVDTAVGTMRIVMSAMRLKFRTDSLPDAPRIFFQTSTRLFQTSTSVDEDASVDARRACIQPDRHRYLEMADCHDVAVAWSQSHVAVAWSQSAKKPKNPFKSVTFDRNVTSDRNERADLWQPPARKIGNPYPSPSSLQQVASASSLQQAATATSLRTQVPSHGERQIEDAVQIVGALVSADVGADKSSKELDVVLQLLFALQALALSASVSSCVEQQYTAFANTSISLMAFLYTAASLPVPAIELLTVTCSHAILSCGLMLDRCFGRREDVDQRVYDDIGCCVLCGKDATSVRSNWCFFSRTVPVDYEWIFSSQSAPSSSPSVTTAKSRTVVAKCPSSVPRGGYGVQFGKHAVCAITCRKCHDIKAKCNQVPKKKKASTLQYNLQYDSQPLPAADD